MRGAARTRAPLRAGIRRLLAPAPRYDHLVDRPLVVREALVRLVLERGWEAVSVQDVCERADVGRSTFYLHFADKEELLVSGFGDLWTTLRAHLKPGREPLAFTTALFEHAREHQPLFAILVGRRTGVVVQRAFLALVGELVALDLEVEPAAATPTQGAAVAYVVGAFWELLRWWLEQHREASAAEVGALFKRPTGSVMRELQRPERLRAPRAT